MSDLSNPESAPKLSEGNEMLNEPAIFKITSYMNVLGIIFIIIGALVFIFSIISILSPSVSPPNLKKISWILFLFQLFPFLISLGFILSGYYLRQSGSRFQRFLYFKNIIEFNGGLEFQRKYFLMTLIITILGIVSIIIMVIISIAMIGSILGGFQTIS